MEAENLSAKNLRIGNWVQDKNGIEQYIYRLWVGGAELAEDENGGDDLDYSEDEIFGIPINEEWLIKLGFKDISNSIEKRFIKDNFNWYSSSNEVVVELDNGLNGYDLCTDCRHVHELQNLFFVITGRELELKTDV